jgi:hypothetical protein
VTRQHGGGGRALQRDQRPVVQYIDRDTRGQMRPQMGDVGVLAGRIDDQKQVIPDIGDHQIVQNAARVIREHGVAHAARRETRDIARYQGLECRHPIIAPHTDLPHMRHIEDGGPGARMIVFRQDSRRILHRHFVSGKRHHLAALRNMQIVQDSPFQVGVVVFGTGDSTSSSRMIGPECRSLRAPSVR